jgi:hypothetical protein
MTAHSITLLLPPLATPEGGWPVMPALQRLLSRGRREAAPSAYSSCLLDLFGLRSGRESDLPVAALSALGDGLDAGEGWWLHADPVHLVADRDQLFLSASASLGISQAEADTLLAELNRTYADDGWHFVAATPQRWYLRLPQPLVMRTTPTSGAMGRRVGEVLPQGEDALLWQRVMTEVQMVLHGSPINMQREAQGALTVNGIWFWGGGPLPQQAAGSEWQRVVGDQPLARGLALHHGLPLVSAATASLSEGEGKVLWVADERPLALAELERDYFAPLHAMLREGKLSHLVIELPGQGRWRIEAKALRRWWRRRKPLARLLKGSG